MFMEITISGEDKKLLKQVEELAKRLGLKVFRKPVKPEINDANKVAIEALQQLSQMGAFKEIEDPAAWQKQIRKDRNMR